MEKKILAGQFLSPDERRSFEQGRIEILKLGDATVGRAVFEPGWKWSEHVRPIAKTKSCQAAHTMFVVSGRMHVVMDDGEEAAFGPGECGYVPPGHDAWVLGDDPCVVIDFTGMRDYATGSRDARGASTSGPQPHPH